MADEVREVPEFNEKYAENDKEYKKKLARHRRFIIYRIIAIVAASLFIIVMAYSSYRNMIYSDYTILDTLQYEDSAGANFRNFNGNVLKYSRDGATAFNMDNNMLFNQTYEMQNPMVDICGDYVALGDYKGTKVYVMNSEGLQGQIDTTLPVQRFAVAANGNIAIVLEEDEITWVRLYNKEGEIVASDRTTMKKSGFPLSMDISDNGIMLNISYLYIDSGKISSSVAFYNFGSVGQNEIDNLVSGYNYDDETITYVQFMNSSTAFAIGNTQFSIFKGDQRPERVFDVTLEDEVRSIFNNDSYIGLVYDQTSTENPYRLDVYNTSGDIVLSKEFSLEYTDILFNKDFVIIYNANECLICDISGNEKYSGLFKNSIITMVPNGNKTRYLFVSGSRTDEIQLK
ncbi:MAG: DUF5711 family protein [Lachnospiraceae bacterium]|nr:DUF5711 family protein [Lachnospiraceae bacterium]